MTAVAPTVLTAAMATVALALAWSAVSDVRSYLIPNWTSLLIAGIFPVVAILTPYAHLWAGLATGVGVFALGLVLFALGWLGGGDVKLLSALALWCGPSRLAPFTIIVCLAGAALALFMLSPLRRFAPAPSAEAAAAAGQPMPYGVAIAIGGAWLISQYAALLA
jgi:prepilin peptidase CpaA